MLSLLTIFGIMMLPGIAVLATSLVVGVIESASSSSIHKIVDDVSSCWKVEA